MKDLFPLTYTDSRARFRQDAAQASQRWPVTRLEAYPLTVDPSLTIDVLWAEPRRPHTVILISAGLHGIEGYVGAAMLRVFMNELAPRLPIEQTGLLLVHAVNPWGMAHRRRYNENNVDLNRNFLWEERFDPHLNPDYEQLVALLNPTTPIRSLLWSDLVFFGRLFSSLARLGVLRIRQGMLSGQYRHPQGVQFGGQATQESTAVMRSLFEQAFRRYERIIHIDLHTGYGPRYQMSLVNSARESTSPSEWIQRFRYPRVLAATLSDFYVVTGDITDYLYRLREERFPTTELFATCFEFGTFGDSLPAQIRSLRITVLENRLFHYDAISDSVRCAIRREYEELFYPSEPRWREQALADYRQAMEGLLSAFDLL